MLGWDVICLRIIFLADSVFITRFLIREREAFPPAELAKISTTIKKPETELRVFHDPYPALSTALQSSDARDLILVTGSLFLAGELRKHWISEEYILSHRRSFR